MGKKVLYRVDPTLPLAKRVSQGKTITVLPGSTGKKRRGSAKRSARLAFVLSKAGRSRSRVKAAAVDLLVLHYVQGGRWALDGVKTRKRVRGMRHGKRVVRVARTLAKKARKFAGPYQVQVSGTPMKLGGTTTLTARVLSASGHPLPRRRVGFNVEGEDAGSVRTDALGVASVEFISLAGVSGYSDIQATVNLPASVLTVRRGVSARRASRMVSAEAGTQSGAGRVAVIGSQLISVLPPVNPIAGPGAQMKPRVQIDSITEGGSDQEATTTIYGPFSTEAVATRGCVEGERLAATSRGLIPGVVGIQNPPSVPVLAEGWYAVRIDVAGNEVNSPATSCAVHKELRQPVIRAYIQVSGPQVNPSSGQVYRDVTLAFDVSNLPTGYDGLLNIGRHERYRGAEIHTSCSGGASLEASVQVNNPDRIVVTTTVNDVMVNGNPQVYDWVATLDPVTEFMAPTASECGAARYTAQP